MDAKRVRDMNIVQLHKFAICLDLAGFNEGVVESIIEAGNKNANCMAATMLSTLINKYPGEIAKVLKFAPLRDLGDIVVPQDYVHTKALAKYRIKWEGSLPKKFTKCNPVFNDKNFSNPSRKLKSGEILRVKVWYQLTDDETSSEERLAFLDTLPGNVFTGAQGLALVCDNLLTRLPLDCWIASMDRKERLYHTPGTGEYKLPMVEPEIYKEEYRNDKLLLGDFDKPRSGSVAFFSFQVVQEIKK